MQEVVDAFNDSKFCDFAIPVPESLQIVAGKVGSDDQPEQIALVEAENKNLELYGHKNWYDFCVNEWGTKWDVDPLEPVEYNVLENSAVTLGFDSAWAPPIGVYQALIHKGYEIRAYYYEPGMAFAGIWDNGDDDYYELGSSNSHQVRDLIPSDLDAEFNISESIEMWEEDYEELSEWYEEGVTSKGLEPHEV